jgi:uncharacterized protein YqjF (DUF2071 family)
MENEKGSEVRISLEASITTTTAIVPKLVEPPGLEARKALQQEPTGTPVMYQTWSDLLFLHWEWDPAEIQARLPGGLYVDTFGEKAYVAVTPFFMNDVRASFFPEIPGTANFLELNVRTYVYDRNGVPGVWFFSLDCNQNLAVLMARLFYSLPYFSADIEAKEDSGLFEYRCHRAGEREAARFHYRKEDRTVNNQPGSLPFFLTERYALFAHSSKTGKLYSARVHHAPWQLFHAHLGKWDETMLRINKLDPKLRPPAHQWIAAPVRVKIYALGEV